MKGELGRDVRPPFTPSENPEILFAVLFATYRKAPVGSIASAFGPNPVACGDPANSLKAPFVPMVKTRTPFTPVSATKRNLVVGSANAATSAFGEAIGFSNCRFAMAPVVGLKVKMSAPPVCKGTY